MNHYYLRNFGIYCNRVFVSDERGVVSAVLNVSTSLAADTAGPLDPMSLPFSLKFLLSK